MLKIKNLLVPIILVVLVISVAILIPIMPLRIISISQVYIEPKGYEGADKEWKGSYWVIYAYADSESYSALKFDEGFTEPYPHNIEGKDIIPKAVIEITIHPKQPYYSIPLVHHSVRVTPKAADWRIWQSWPWRVGDITVGSMFTDYYTFEGSWTLHTPFTVEIVKTIGENKFSLESGLIDPAVDGIGHGYTFANPRDKDEKFQIIVLSTETAGGYPPSSDYLLFGEKVFKDETRLRRIIDGTKSYSFSKYWFGDLRVPEGQNFAGEAVPSFDTWNKEPGWKYGTTWWGGPDYDHWIPIEPTENHLLGYIQGDNILDGGPGYEPVNLKKKQSDTEKVVWTENEVRLYIDRRKASSSFQMMISTELADAIVWQPYLAKGEFTEVSWLATGNDYVEISDTQRAHVKVKCTEGFGDLIVDTEITEHAKITPTGNSWSFETGEEHLFTFDVKNLGVTEETEGEVTFTLTNSFGEFQDTATLRFKLKKTDGEETTVTIYVVNKDGDLLDNMDVTIEWNGQKETQSTTNGMVDFYLGDYAGSVKITVAETDIYVEKSISVGVKHGDNTFTITMSETLEPEFPWVMLITTSLIIIGVVVMIYYASKRTKAKTK